MKKIEKLIYSVKFLPQVLYFGSSALILLIIIFDIEFIPIIPVFVIFLYMTYLAIKNYKKSESSEMDKLEKLIYSVKYLPQILYFSSLGWVAYTIYYDIYFDESVTIFGIEFIFIDSPGSFLSGEYARKKLFPNLNFFFRDFSKISFVVSG